MISADIRYQWGERLVSTALTLAAERREIERGLASEAPETRGVGGAMISLAPARWLEVVLVWIGCRLQPRSIQIHSAAGD
jgi:hypothetical protein